ncbi:MAG: hypothetical protein IT288_04505 [Bdellovibrionales bacterium]|nr:hypothetical protein [Bdellovibrionales bacterium]
MSKYTFAEVTDLLAQRTDRPRTLSGRDQARLGLSRLGLNWEPLAARTVVVAGTNGKGSVCRALEHFFLSDSKPVALFTSPHLVHVRERIRLNGKAVTEADFVRAFGAVEAATSDLALSHFETLILMAAWLFQANLPPDSAWYIFEVGIGGTFDATNAFAHQTSVITALGLDHQELLGSSLLSIARQKFGIISPHSKVFHLPGYPPEVVAELRELKTSLGLHLQQSQTPQYDVRDDFPLPQEQIETPCGRFSLPLPGFHSAQNLQLAIEVAVGLGLNLRPGLSQLDQLYWPGRLDVLSTPRLPCPILLSGDHNPLGIKALGETLKHIPYQNVHFLVGIGKAKDRSAILHDLSRVPRSTLLLTSTPFRGSSDKDFSEWIERGIGFDPLPAKALTRIWAQAQAQDLIVVTGSLYLVGQIYQQALEGGWLTPKQTSYFD